MKIHILYPKQETLYDTGPFYSDTQISCLFLRQEASLDRKHLYRYFDHSFT